MFYFQEKRIESMLKRRNIPTDDYENSEIDVVSTLKSKNRICVTIYVIFTKHQLNNVTRGLLTSIFCHFMYHGISFKT